MDVVRYKYLNPLAPSCPLVLVVGVVLLWAGSRVAWKAKGGPKPLGLVLGEAVLVIVALLFIGLLLFGTAPF